MVDDIEQANGFANLGDILLAVMNVAQVLSGVAGAAMSARFGMSKTINIGVFFFVAFIFSLALSSWRAIQSVDEAGTSWFHQMLMNKPFIVAILVATSFGGGIGMSFTAQIQGEYITLCSTEKTKGFYFGYVWCWYMAS